VDDVNVDVERPARDTPLPPGILVSLAQQVLGSLAAGPARFDVRTCRRADSFDLELSATAVSIESGAALRDFTRRARERLRLALGAQGDITLLHDTPGRLTLRITLGKGRGADHGESAKH
jgi:hypothetical protein